jgi:hypothetical protein
VKPRAAKEISPLLFFNVIDAAHALAYDARGIAIVLPVFLQGSPANDEAFLFLVEFHDVVSAMRECCLGSTNCPESRGETFRKAERGKEDTSRA